MTGASPKKGKCIALQLSVKTVLETAESFDPQCNAMQQLKDLLTLLMLGQNTLQQCLLVHLVPL